MSDINVLQSKEEGLEDLEAFSGYVIQNPVCLQSGKKLSSKKKKKEFPRRKTSSLSMLA